MANHGFEAMPYHVYHDTQPGVMYHENILPRHPASRGIPATGHSLEAPRGGDEGQVYHAETA